MAVYSVRLGEGNIAGASGAVTAVTAGDGVTTVIRDICIDIQGQSGHIGTVYLGILASGGTYHRLQTFETEHTGDIQSFHWEGRVVMLEGDQLYVIWANLAGSDNGYWISGYSLD